LCATDQRQRDFRIETAIVKGSARNRTGEFAGAWRQQRLHIVDRRKAARGDHRHRDTFGQLNRCVPIDSFQETVARDIGEDDGCDAGILESPGDIEGGYLGGLGPALHGDLSIARIESYRDTSRKFSRGTLDQLRIAHGRGTDDNARDALAEPGLNRFQVPDAAAELHRHGNRRQHRLDRIRVHRLAGKGTIEIDNVQIFESLRGKARGPRRRIKVEHGCARHVALLQTHALAVFQIDRGKQDHGGEPAPSPHSGDEISETDAKPIITASTSGSSISAPDRNVGSSPDEIAYRWRCPGRRSPSRVRRSRLAPARRPDWLR
jgi:hypothetical protein